MRQFLFIFLTVLLIACDIQSSNELKIINTKVFEIKVPASWEYKKEKGIDSFVGRIVGKNVELYFDYSEMGYANYLIPTIEEFVFEEELNWMPIVPAYMKSGVIYTCGDVENKKASIMKKQGIKDFSKVKVEKYQTPKKEILCEKGKYTAILTYKDTVEIIDINIPEKIKKYHFEIDTIGKYYRKIITPKNGTKGITGVYFKDLHSNFNFHLFGKNLSIKNQTKAIKAFKTIKFKR